MLKLYHLARAARTARTLIRHPYLALLLKLPNPFLSPHYSTTRQYLAILFRFRYLLNPPSVRSPQAQLRDRQKSEDGDELKPIKFLFTHYRLGCWYFEVVESYKRVAFISLLALISDKTIAGFVGMALSILFSHGTGPSSPNPRHSPLTTRSPPPIARRPPLSTFHPSPTTSLSLAPPPR